MIYTNNNMDENSQPMPFQRGNYLRLLGALCLIIIGFVIMGAEDAPYGLGILGLTIGPIMVLLGYIVGFFSIFYEKKSP